MPTVFPRFSQLIVEMIVSAAVKAPAKASPVRLRSSAPAVATFSPSFFQSISLTSFSPALKMPPRKFSPPGVRNPVIAFRIVDPMDPKSSSPTAPIAVPKRPLSHSPAVVITLVTPFQIAVPIPPHSRFSDPSRPRPNRSDRNFPAESISFVMPFQIAVPTSFQSIFLTASQAVTNRSCSHTPALSRIPTIPFRMDVPRLSQSISFSFSRSVLPIVVRLSKIAGRLSNTPFTILKIDSAAPESTSPRDSVREFSAGVISIPLISAIPRLAALVFILDREFANVFAMVL